MGSRLDLHTILTNLLGSTYVYFQPPESIKLEYPCIVYKKDKLEAKYANDQKYTHSTRYQVTTITRDPDSQLPGSVFDLPLCDHERNFVSEGLIHDVFILYY